jgi:hypothetical protein
MAASVSKKSPEEVRAGEKQRAGENHQQQENRT